MMEISVRAVWINLPLCLYKVILVLGNIALRVIDTRVAFDFEFAIFMLLDTIYQYHGLLFMLELVRVRGFSDSVSLLDGWDIKVMYTQYLDEFILYHN